MKKVSVIIPAYNKAALTIKTIKSVLGQTYGNIEIIVVDDGSTDDTKNKLQLFGDKIHYIYKQNGGACSARNVGIKQATGEYIALIDCDDIYYPEKIAKSVECLEKKSDYGFVYTGAYLINDDGDVISEHRISDCLASGWIASRLILCNFVCNSTVVIRKECFKEVGYFDENIFIPADWDMWLRLSEKYKASYIDDKLTGYRLTDSYTASNMETGLNEINYVLNKALSRNNHLYSGLIKRCLSTVYFTYGVNYAVMQDFKQSRETLLKSVLNKPYGLRGILLLGGMLFVPKLCCKIILYLRPNKYHLISV
ncbi:MAG: glycosyltransferase [Proteobacteria bacterium]|nr:glycosyltransferase [Pseudomonadota bacterium]